MPIPTACLLSSSERSAVVRRAELDAGDVAQARHLAVLAGLDDDVAELLLAFEPSSCIDGELEIDIWYRRRGADNAGGRLHVLGADLVHHIAGRQAALSDLLWIEPDAHRVVTRTEYFDLADTGNPGKTVLNVQHAVIAQIGDVVAVVRRDQVDDQDEVRRTFRRGDAKPANLLRQAGLGL